MIGAGIVLMAGGMAAGGSPLLFVVYNAVCFGLLLLDYVLSPKGGTLLVRRDSEDTLYYKTENTITLFVLTNCRKSLQVRLRDDLPAWHFTRIGPDPAHTVYPGEEQAFTYTVLPTKRGSFMFNRVHLQMTGLLGLCTKTFFVQIPQEMKVYPNLTELSKYRLITQKNRLLEMGDRRIRLQGGGTEFESLRDYVEGDDFRKINWNNTARRNKLTVNRYEMEKNQPVLMLLDTGRPMSYTLKGYKKLDYAINAALMLSDIVNQKGDNSGLMVFDTSVQAVIMPGKGERHRNTLMETLYHVKETTHISNYDGVFRDLVAKQKRRSIVFIFTDFETLEEAKMLIGSIGIITRRHIPIIVLMKNESVRSIADSTDETLKGFYDKAMAQDILRERKNIMKALNARGVLCIETDAEKFALAAINTYLTVKNRNVV